MYAFTKLFAVLSSFEATITERRDDKGVTAIEYALMAAAIAGFVAAAVLVLGPRLEGLFGAI